MFWLIFRTTIYLSLFALIWYGGQFYISSELNKDLHKMTPDTIFVNKKILENQDYAIEQDGSYTYPFATITQALEVIQKDDTITIIISDGSYDEELILPENTTLYGDGAVTISQGIDVPSIRTITTANNTKLINLTVTGGNHTIYIPHNTSLTLLNSTISGADDFGIKMDKKERAPDFKESTTNLVYEFFNKTKEEIEAMPLVRISNSTITKNDNQGLYLQNGRVEILNSQVIENGEEGIDLHPHMHTTIKNTNASNNGESGLESEIYDNIIIIENSTFNNNIKNGLGFITSHGLGNITVSNNTINDNQKFGIRCAVHKSKPKQPRPFFSSMITNINNTLENNIKANIDSTCITF
ncbi:MAG: right-handed parallel beta-helix repeat-containing protein [Candidatus Moraniibacteriota bacterium]|jgi:Right handed beta helix region